MPYIRTAKPSITEPASLRLSDLLAIIISTPIKAMIGEKASGLRSFKNILLLLIPTKLSNQAVTVVPILVPMITPTDCSSVIMLELTSPTSITVTAEEL